MNGTPALAISFVDPERGLHGTARESFTLLFEDGEASSFAEPITVESGADGWLAHLPSDLHPAFRPLAPPVELGGIRAHVCAMTTGTDSRVALEGLGVVAEIHSPPRWSELAATRYVCALFDAENAVVAFARRPEGSAGHGDELVSGHLWAEGEWKGVETARLSTIYDGEGRPRQASMELWLPAEDFPRRAFGHVMAGASLALDGLDVHAAVFGWRMEQREGAGLYELTVREPAPAAA
ncbi:MAG: hypothetical protein QOH13_151 [Thermoleophilaceae bacterium]|nr:hypothetical protein [Thermoleophilaceae bacterium]